MSFRSGIEKTAVSFGWLNKRIVSGVGKQVERRGKQYSKLHDKYMAEYQKASGKKGSTAESFKAADRASTKAFGRLNKARQAMWAGKEALKPDHRKLLEEGTHRLSWKHYPKEITDLTRKYVRDVKKTR